MRGIQTKPEPYCPLCGCRMALRRPDRAKGQTWKEFWGCSDFPNCKGTREIGEDGKPEEVDEWWDVR